MGKIRDLVHQIEMASPSGLGKLLDEVNRAAFQDNDWNQVSVKASYALLLAELDSEGGQIKMSYDFGNLESKCVDCITGDRYSFNNLQALQNMKLAYEFFSNPPVVENPNSEQVAVDVEAIDWDKPVYTTDDLKKLLNVSDNTLRKWLNGGWISYTQMEGSDKKYVAKEDLMAFLKNEKIFYPSSK